MENTRPEGIPSPAVRRLSLYLRQLEASRHTDRMTISSKQLGQSLGLTDAQVRKDLAYFGQFGHPGIGYRVQDLISEVRHILGTDRTWNVLLVGAGNLGRTWSPTEVSRRKGFGSRPFSTPTPRRSASGSARSPSRPWANCLARCRRWASGWP